MSHTITVVISVCVFLVSSDNLEQGEDLLKCHKMGDSPMIRFFFVSEVVCDKFRHHFVKIEKNCN